MSRRTIVFILAGLLAAPNANPAPASARMSIVLGTETGAVFDAVFDGYPRLAAFDGQPDFLSGYQTLAVALQSPITELRGIGEFPLAPLDAAPEGSVARATLTFNVDDVIASFGPGTGFSGSAARDILVHLYAGNGTVDVTDYLAVSRAPLVIDTRHHGSITDRTIESTGPLRFDVDVTEEVRALIELAPAAIGVVWRTTDSPTATSLDHLGQEGAGPPGIRGAFLPFLTVEFIEPTATATATPTADPPTATPTASPTPSAAPTETATPVALPPSTPSVTPTQVPICAGDCNSDGTVTVDELVLGVSLALGTSADPCAAMDVDGDQVITITDILRAVSSAIEGC